MPERSRVHRSGLWEVRTLRAPQEQEVLGQPPLGEGDGSGTGAVDTLGTPVIGHRTYSRSTGGLRGGRSGGAEPRTAGAFRRS